MTRIELNVRKSKVIAKENIKSDINNNDAESQLIHIDLDADYQEKKWSETSKSFKNTYLY